MPSRLSRFLCIVAAITAAFLPYGARAQSSAKSAGKLRFEISFSGKRSAAPLTGRVVLVLATTMTPEPRFQSGYTALTAAQMFGVNVNDWTPGKPVIVDASVLGYPIENLAKVPPGDYYVQAVLNIYNTYHLANGHTVELPPDKGEGQHWNQKPGNPYSVVKQIHVDPASNDVIHIALTQVMPPIDLPKDTEWIKYVRIESALLTKFYGKPTFITGDVLLPPGWNEHPNAHYPLMVYQGHFAHDWRAPIPFRTDPPTPQMKGRKRVAAEYAYRFYQDWTSGRLPHFLVLSIQHANPYFDDSYAVNSENVGPYGDAITKELIPEVEKRFRGIGQGWARAVYGGSTGGWETLASQVFYPDFYNGAWTACPDPVDFRAYQTVNLYDDKNAFWVEGPFAKVPRSMMRTQHSRILETALRPEPHHTDELENSRTEARG
ncbi:MAG: alpha/beta hydrolase [Candidatus Acidiferrales bacterium]